MDDGGRYMPSSFQKKLWGMWQEFWADFVPKLTEGEPFDVVVNGDLVDGVHHNSVTQWSHNLEYQRRCAVRVLKPVMDACGGRMHVIRGTEAHGGQSGQDEEAVARELGVKPNDEGQYATYDLWKNVGEALVHFTHHVGTTGVSAYETTAIWKEYIEFCVDSARWGDRPPDGIVRSHRHRHIRVDAATGNGQAVAVVTPGWQGKTPFAYKLPGGRAAQPQFGGVVLAWAQSTGLYERSKVWRLDRSRTV
jgi:hypothetical protein